MKFYYKFHTKGSGEGGKDITNEAFCQKSSQFLFKSQEGSILKFRLNALLSFFSCLHLMKRV